MKNPVVFLIAGLVLFAGCTSSPSQEETTTTQPIRETTTTSITLTTTPSSTTSSSTSTSVTTTLEVEPQTRFFNVLARSWYFDPGIIVVNKGDTVILNVTARDNNHGVGLNEFDINIDIRKDETALIEFQADKSGNFTFYCTDPSCGPGHKYMKGTLEVR